MKYTKEGKDHPINKFFTDLGSAAGAIKPASEGGSDEKVERAVLAKVSLCRFVLPFFGVSFRCFLPWKRISCRISTDCLFLIFLHSYLVSESSFRTRRS